MMPLHALTLPSTAWFQRYSVLAVFHCTSASAEVDHRDLKVRSPELHKTEQDNAVYSAIRAIGAIASRERDLRVVQGTQDPASALCIGPFSYVFYCCLVSERFGSLDALGAEVLKQFELRLQTDGWKQQPAGISCFIHKAFHLARAGNTA